MRGPLLRLPGGTISTCSSTQRSHVNSRPAAVRRHGGARARPGSSSTRRDRAGQGDRIVRCDRERGVADHFRERGACRRHHGRAAREPFERREAEALFERRVRDHLGAPEERRHHVVVDVAGAHHLGRDAARGNRVAHFARAPAVGAGEHEPEVGSVGGDPRERAHEGRARSCAARSCSRTRRTAARCRGSRARRGRRPRRRSC